MIHYDFRGLSPFDFEDLTRTLMQAELNVTLEAFATGPDSGIDFRFSRNKTIIIQCKHYGNTGATRLIKDLKKELPKVAKLKPDRYIISTSVSLTSLNKEKIMSLFEPYIQTTQDIFGANDLNGLLDKFPEIARQNIKLYLTNWAVLSTVINSDIYSWTNIIMNDAKRKAILYVPSRKHVEARFILEKHHVCVISGVPGIGKTTLAEMLLLDYDINKWQIHAISSDIVEAQRVYNKEVKQLFFYDDFLGQIGLTERLIKNEDDRLARFVSQIMRDETKRLILTTREYILEYAKLEYEKLSRLPLYKQKCIIDLADYRDIDRAKIFYNHLYHSALPSDWIINIATRDKYLDVICHENFNPRLIETLFELASHKINQANEFSKFIMENLDNPQDLWKHPFEALSSEARKLLLYMVSLPGRIPLEDLKKMYLSFANGPSEDHLVEFDKTLKIFEKTFTRTDFVKDQDRFLISFHNSSVADFLIFYLSKNPEYTSLILRKSLFFIQPVALWRYTETSDGSKVSLANSLRGQLSHMYREEFLSALKNTFFQITPPGFPVIIDTEVPIYTLEAHLIIYHAILRDIGSVIEREFIRMVAVKLMDAWKIGQYSRNQCVEALKIITDTSDFTKDEIAEYIHEAKKIILSANFTEATAYDDLLNLHKQCPECLTKEEIAQIRQCFEAWLVGTAYQSLPSQEEDVLDPAVRWLRQIAELMQVELNEQIMRTADDRIAAYKESAHAKGPYAGYRNYIKNMWSMEFIDNINEMCKSLVDNLSAVSVSKIT